MATSHAVDSEDIWRRVGLGELRLALAQVSELSREFERVLQSLPSCNQCARVALLEQIHGAGKALGRQALSLTVLAESLKGAVATAEQTQAELAEHAPYSCRCPATPCTCHE
jgi:hypothetical protein